MWKARQVWTQEFDTEQESGHNLKADGNWWHTHYKVANFLAKSAQINRCVHVKYRNPGRAFHPGLQHTSSGIKKDEQKTICTRNKSFIYFKMIGRKTTF